MVRERGPSWCRRLQGHSLVLALWFCPMMLTACTVGPNFQRPQVQVPAGWVGSVSAPTSRPLTSAEEDLARWWTVFQDPILTSLMERAVGSNLDLKLAEARVRQAWAARGVAVSGLGPTVDAAGFFRRTGTPTTGLGKATVVVSDQYQAGFDAGWELDIFGGVRRGIEAADADLQAAVEGRRDVLVTLTAEVARNYVELRAFQERIAIAKRNLAAQARTADVTRRRFEGGFVSGLDAANADAQVATTAAQIPLLEASAHQTIYTLSLLLGREPGALIEELSPTSDIPAAPPAPPLGVPSDLIRRRPDIRRAEEEIHGATARIGVATADLYPKFTISGSVKLQASDFASWFSWASRLWSFGPSMSWRLFDTGRTRSNIAQQEALQEQSLITFHQAVLAALQEVENALIASTKEEEHRRALEAAVAANRKAVELSMKLYTEGLTDFLNVLQAQRALYLSEEEFALSTRTLSTLLIALYKALGGGWEAEPDTRESS
jgi:outer membrane protein, multidrug efflux system